MKFDINKFMEKIIAVNCQTKDEARAYLKFLDDNGFVWVDEEKLTQDIRWDKYEQDTCYSIWVGDTKRYVTFGSKKTYLNNRCEVIPYGELEFEEAK